MWEPFYITWIGLDTVKTNKFKFKFSLTSKSCASFYISQARPFWIWCIHVIVYYCHNSFYSCKFSSADYLRHCKSFSLSKFTELHQNSILWHCKIAKSFLLGLFLLQISIFSSKHLRKVVSNWNSIWLHCTAWTRLQSAVSSVEIDSISVVTIGGANCMFSISFLYVFSYFLPFSLHHSSFPIIWCYRLRQMMETFKFLLFLFSVFLPMLPWLSPVSTYIRLAASSKFNVWWPNLGAPALFPFDFWADGCKEDYT